MTKWLRDISETLIFVMLALFVLQLAFPRYTIEGPSMEPTLQDGQRIITLPQFISDLTFWTSADDEYQVGDIVVFSPPAGFTQDIIKRVVAVGGDVVDIRGDGHLYVNGSLSPHTSSMTDGGRQTYPLTVQPGAYFVLGDNRGNSSDSRAWGPLAGEMIQGRLLAIYWPLGDLEGF